MTHKFESGFFGNNQPAWHGLGTVIEEDVIHADRLWELVPDLALEVRKLPIWAQTGDTKGFKVPDQMAVYREDGVYLGVVGDGYQVIQNRDAMGFLDDLLGQRVAKVHTAGVLNGGRQTWIQCRRPENILIGGIKDEEHEAYITFLNSFDGSTPVQAIVGLMRVVCWNTYNAAMSEATNSYKFKHTMNSPIRVAEAKYALKIADSYWEATAKLGAMAIKTPFADKQFMNVLDQCIPLPSQHRIDYDPEAHKRLEANAEEQRDMVKMIWINSPSLQNIRGTTWAAINTWTEYLDHHTSSRTTTRGSQAENRMKRIMFDTSLRDKAVKLVRQEAELLSIR